MICGAHTLHNSGAASELCRCVLALGHIGRHETHTGELFPAPVTEESVVNLAEIREWRQKHEQNYNKLVTFVRELSQTRTYKSYDAGSVIFAHWKEDARDLLSTIEN